MRKTPSTDLFWLIKSLDKGEKRNFKLMAKVVMRGGAKRYMELYELLEGWDAPDEEALARRFGDQLANIKHYLYGLVLRSLSHFDTSHHATFAATREQVRILMEKELFGQAEKLLDRAIEDARSREWWEELSQLLSLKIVLSSHLSTVPDLHKDPKRVEALLDEEERAYRHHKLIRDLQALASMVARKIRQPACAVGSAARQQLRAEVMAHPLMVQHSAAYPVQARYTYHKIVAYLENDVYSSLWREALEQILTLVETYPAIFDSSWLDWFPFTVQLVGAHAQERDFAAADAAYARLTASSQQSSKFRSIYQAKLIWLHIQLEVCRGDATLLAQALQTEEPCAIELLGKVFRREGTLLCFIFTFGHLMLGQPKAALTWIKRFWTINTNMSSSIIHVHLRKWNILAHFDLGNYTVVEAELQSLKRLSLKQGIHSASDRFFQRAMRKLLKAEEDEDRTDVVERLIARYELLLQNDLHAEWTERMIHLWAWLRAKTDGKPPCAYTWYLQRTAPHPIP